MVGQYTKVNKTGLTTRDIKSDNIMNPFIWNKFDYESSIHPWMVSAIDMKNVTQEDFLKIISKSNIPKFRLSVTFTSLTWPLAKTFNFDFCRQVTNALY